MKAIVAISMLSMLLVALAGCDSKGVSSGVPGQVTTVQVQIGNGQFDLEVADNEAARQRGLMYRRQLAANAGMLFVFEHSRVLTFWMRNTYIPLDIIFLDRDGKVVSIKQLKPLDETTVESDHLAKYAIELNAGAAQKVGAKVGDTIKLPMAE